MEHPRSVSVMPRPSFDSFPADILITIFEYLALTPRLWSVSCVCRRWRIIALPTIRSLPLLANVLPDLMPKAFGLLTGLTALDMRTCTSSLVIPSTVRELRLGPSTCCRFRLTSNLTSLTLSTPQCCACYVDLLMNNTGLTHLSLRLGSDIIDQPPYHFPQLRSIKLKVSTYPGPDLLTTLTPLIRAHASQLTQLSVYMQFSDVRVCLPELLSIRMPLVRRLRIYHWGEMDDTVVALSNVLTTYPALTTLNLLLTDVGSAAVEVLVHSPLSALAELRLAHVSPEVAPLLALLSNIHYLNADMPLTMGARITSLRRLDLSGDTRGADLPALGMPHLRKWLYATSFKELIHPFVFQCPALRELCIRVAQPVELDAWDIILDRLRAAEQHGIEKIKFILCGRDHFPLQAIVRFYRRKSCWMRITVAVHDQVTLILGCGAT